MKTLHYEPVAYMSGTVIVIPRGEDAEGQPHLYVHYSNDITRDGLTEQENERKRYETAIDLAKVLNSGAKLPFLNDWRRESPDTLRRVLTGGTIRATGPMVLPLNDNGRLAWMEDPSEKAQQARKALIDRLDRTMP